MSKNEGEGNRTAARRYNEGARRTARSKNLPDPQPGSAQELNEMEEAERKGRERAKELDPAVKRDYSRPGR